MNRKSAILFCVVLLLAAHPGSVLACAACYGQSDSAMATGMNWGIFSLLAIVTVVLGSVGTFFVFLAKRPAMMNPTRPEADKAENHSDKHGTV